MISVFCDESCHLRGQDFGMTMGAIAVPSQVVSVHNKNIRELKQRHGLPEFLEMKWTKVSLAKLTAYQALADYFFEHPDMMFRGVLVARKPMFDDPRGAQAYDSWHNEMYYSLLRKYAVGDERCRIFIAKGTHLAREIRGMLRGSMCDFEQGGASPVQEVRPSEVQIMSLVDVIVGALSYHCRGDKASDAKFLLADYIRTRSGCSWNESTFFDAKKFNLLVR